MLKIYQYVFIFLFIFAICCNKKGNNNHYNCHLELSVIDTLKEQSGTLIFDDKYNVYVVQSSPIGTIDSRNLYILCNTPEQLPETGKTVTVSGYVRSSNLRSPVWGTTYYELEVTSFH